MRKLITFLFLFFSYLFVNGQPQLHIDSTKFMKGSDCCTGINFSIPTADKGILFVGTTYNTPGGIIPYSPYAGENVLVGKIDSTLKISWIKIYGGNGDDAPIYAVQTSDGGFAILASTASNDGDVTGFKGVTDAWLFKIDDTGKFLWGNCYGSTSQDYGISIDKTPDKGFIILGGSNGSDNDVPFHYGSTWLFDWMVVKIDSTGDVQWSKDMGGTADEGYGSILSVDNGYYIAASSASIDYDCNDTAWHPTIPGTGTQLNYFLLRLDSAGNEVWDSSYGGSHGDNVVYAMFDDRDSSILMMGSTGSNDYMVTGYHGCDDGDMWLVKTNKKGKLLWEKTLGSIQVDDGGSICKAPNGGYLAFGDTYSLGCFDSTINHIGGQDCWLFLLDSSGNTITNKIFGGTDGDAPASIIPYKNGYAATGTSASSFFTEGTCDTNHSGAFITFIGYSSLSVNNVFSSEINLKVYPNPTKTEVNIIVPTGEQGKLVISNTLGQIVYVEELKTQKKYAEINTYEWTNGLYLVQFRSVNGEIVSTKLIKN